MAFISINIASVLSMFYSLSRFKHLKDILLENTAGFPVGGSGCDSYSGHLLQQDKLAPAYSVRHSHFILSYEFLLSILSRARRGDSSPCGVDWGHLVVFGLGLSWTAMSVQESLPHMPDAWQGRWKVGLNLVLSLSESSPHVSSDFLQAAQSFKRPRQTKAEAAHLLKGWNWHSVPSAALGRQPQSPSRLKGVETEMPPLEWRSCVEKKSVAIVNPPELCYDKYSLCVSMTTSVN